MNADEYQIAIFEIIIKITDIKLLKRILFLIQSTTKHG